MAKSVFSREGILQIFSYLYTAFSINANYTK